MTDYGWNPRVIQVIETSLTLRGEGTEESPMRRVRQYYSLEGQLLAEYDPWVEEQRTMGKRDKP